jgi:hypothetical protein
VHPSLPTYPDPDLDALAQRMLDFLDVTPSEQRVPKVIAAIEVLRPIFEVARLDEPEYLKTRGTHYDMPDDEFVQTWSDYIESMSTNFCITYKWGAESLEMEQELKIKLAKIPLDKRYAGHIKIVLRNYAIQLWRKAMSHEGHISYGEGQRMKAERAVDPYASIDGSVAVESILSHLTDVQKIIVTMCLGLDGERPIDDYRRIRDVVKLSVRECEQQYEYAMARLKKIAPSLMSLKSK